MMLDAEKTKLIYKIVNLYGVPFVGAFVSWGAYEFWHGNHIVLASVHTTVAVVTWLYWVRMLHIYWRLRCLDIKIKQLDIQLKEKETELRRRTVSNMEE